MFLESIEIKETARCYNENNYTVQATASVCLTDFLPYLNAVVPKANYKPHAEAISFQEGINIYSLQEKDVVITKLLNTTEAFEKLDWLKDFINDLYNKRDTITPCYDEGKTITMLEVYRLLPGTNCGRCGQLTCMAMAGRLHQREASAEECPLLKNEKYRSQGIRLADLLA